MLRLVLLLLVGLAASCPGRAPATGYVDDADDRPAAIDVGGAHLPGDRLRVEGEGVDAVSVFVSGRSADALGDGLFLLPELPAGTHLIEARRGDFVAGVSSVDVMQVHARHGGDGADDVGAAFNFGLVFDDVPTFQPGSVVSGYVEPTSALPGPIALQGTVVAKDNTILQLRLTGAGGVVVDVDYLDLHGGHVVASLHLPDRSERLRATVSFDEIKHDRQGQQLPQIDLVTRGADRVTYTVTGDHFGRDGGRVTVGDLLGELLSWSDEEVVFRLRNFPFEDITVELLPDGGLPSGPIRPELVDETPSPDAGCGRATPGTVPTTWQYVDEAAQSGFVDLAAARCGYVAAGGFFSGPREVSGVVVRIAASGAVLWRKTFEPAWGQAEAVFHAEHDAFRVPHVLFAGSNAAPARIAILNDFSGEVEHEHELAGVIERPTGMARLGDHGVALISAGQLALVELHEPGFVARHDLGSVGRFDRIQTIGEDAVVMGTFDGRGLLETMNAIGQITGVHVHDDPGAWGDVKVFDAVLTAVYNPTGEAPRIATFSNTLALLGETTVLVPGTARTFLPRTSGVHALVTNTTIPAPMAILGSLDCAGGFVFGSVVPGFALDAIAANDGDVVLAGATADQHGQLQRTFIPSGALSIRELSVNTQSPSVRHDRGLAFLRWHVFNADGVRIERVSGPGPDGPGDVNDGGGVLPLDFAPCVSPGGCTTVYRLSAAAGSCSDARSVTVLQDPSPTTRLLLDVEARLVAQFDGRALPDSFHNSHPIVGEPPPFDSACFLGMGRPYANTALSPYDTPDPNSPGLIFRDLGSTLTGWAYATAVVTPHQTGSCDTPPTSIPFVTPSQWFVHDGGWHTGNGGMVSAPGRGLTQNFHNTPPPASVADACNNASGCLIPHPAFWDVHVFRDSTGAFAPEVRIFSDVSNIFTFDVCPTSPLGKTDPTGAPLWAPDTTTCP